MIGDSAKKAWARAKKSLRAHFPETVEFRTLPGSSLVEARVSASAVTKADQWAGAVRDGEGGPYRIGGVYRRGGVVYLGVADDERETGTRNLITVWRGRVLEGAESENPFKVWDGAGVEDVASAWGLTLAEVDEITDKYLLPDAAVLAHWRALREPQQIEENYDAWDA